MHKHTLELGRLAISVDTRVSPLVKSLLRLGVATLALVAMRQLIPQLVRYVRIETM